uniref:Uncharacterized protein n=1 Tax=Arundo donax TaxID=35708 RepID=A0A0A9I1J3_ARUDO
MRTGPSRRARGRRRLRRRGRVPP